MQLTAFLQQRFQEKYPMQQAAWGELQRKQLGFSAQESISFTAKAILIQFLLTHGGARIRDVVVGDEIRSLRLWDLEHSFTLGAHSSHLLQCLEKACSHDSFIELPSPTEKNDDFFFYHVLHCLLCGCHKVRLFVSSLQKVSPLTRLLKCPNLNNLKMQDSISFEGGGLGYPACSEAEVEKILLHPASSHLILYFADEWSNIMFPNPKAKIESFCTRLNVRRATLSRVLDVIEKTQKLSHLHSFLVFFRRLLRPFWMEQAKQIHEERSWRVSEREQLIESYVGFFQLGQKMRRIEQRLIDEPGPYGWEDPLEVRLYRGQYKSFWSGDDLDKVLSDAGRSLRRSR